MQELLEWRRRQHILARQKNYAEAQKASALEEYWYVFKFRCGRHGIQRCIVKRWRSTTVAGLVRGRLVWRKIIDSYGSGNKFAWERMGSDLETYVGGSFRISLYFNWRRSCRLVSRGEIHLDGIRRYLVPGTGMYYSTPSESKGNGSA